MTTLGTVIAFAVVLAFLIGGPLYAIASIVVAAVRAIRGKPGGAGARTGIDEDNAGSV